MFSQHSHAATSLYLLLHFLRAVIGQTTPPVETPFPSSKTTTTHPPTTSPTNSVEIGFPPTSVSSSSYPSIFSVSFMPLPSYSDGATRPGENNNNDSNSGGLVNYYFVFLALIFAVVAAAIFLFVRRRHRTVLRRRYGQQVALSRDLGGPRPGGGWTNWNPERTRGRYWQGRWRDAETGREEGLNEHGEAPPPYVPKRQSQEGAAEIEPAVPLQTLSREGAGLKPPDYSEGGEYHSPDPNSQTQDSSQSAGAGTSRDAEQRGIS